MKTTREQRAELRRNLADWDHYGMSGDAESRYMRDVPALLDDLDELERERERDTIARARDCGAEPHDPCALPPGTNCDAHTIAELRRELAVAEEKRPADDVPWRASRLRYQVGETVNVGGGTAVCTHVGDTSQEERLFLEVAKYAIRAAAEAGSMVCGDGSDKLRAVEAVADDEKAIAEIIRAATAPVAPWTMRTIAPDLKGDRGLTSLCKRGCGATVAGDGTACDICDALPEYLITGPERDAAARVLATLTRSRDEQIADALKPLAGVLKDDDSEWTHEKTPQGAPGRGESK